MIDLALWTVAAVVVYCAGALAFVYVGAALTSIPARTWTALAAIAALVYLFP